MSLALSGENKGEVLVQVLVAVDVPHLTALGASGHLWY